MSTPPSLDNMSPEQWIKEMKALRDDTVAEAARVLDTRTTPKSAAPALRQVFEPYNNLDIGLAVGTDGSGERFSLEFRPKADMLIVWAFPTEDYESIVYTDKDYWWFNHNGIDDASRDRHEIHRQVIFQILEMLPWAKEDDLLEIAAIEISSRAG